MTDRVSHRHRVTLAQIAFVILVIVIPVAAGIGWAEHQRTTDLQKVERHNRIHAALDDWQLYDAQVASCERVNSIRRRQNVVVGWLATHDPGFPLEPQKVVVCTDVIKEPTMPRPTKEEISDGLH